MEDNKLFIIIVILSAVLFVVSTAAIANKDNSELTPSVQYPFLENTNFSYIH